MITLGYITKINNPDDNIYEVRLPIFEKAGSSKDLPDLSGSYFQATLSQTPGQLNGFLVGDCVVVGFLDNKYSKPVILGKLFVGDDGARGYLNVNALNVSGSVSLSGDIHIGDITYDQLLELVRGVPNLQEQVDKLLAGGGGGEPDNYIVSASVSGNDLTLVPNTGNPIVYSPSTITSVNWGDIEGTLSDQTDLQEALDEKLELYEIQPTDIESVQGNRYILTKDLTDKITSGKYLLKINSNLFEEEPDPDNYTELILKPAFNLKSEWLPQEGIDEVYEFETISTFFDTGITLAIFAYNETLDRCIFDTTTSQKSITIPIGLQADTANNSIKLYSGDVGYGDEAYLATINNQPIVGGGNIDTPNDNDYHEPRFSSGLSIASSSNLSEMYVPYATSSTYGVLKDIYYPSSNPSNFASQGYVDTIAAYTYASAVSYISSVLTSYATQSWVSSNYLPLSGATVDSDFELYTTADTNITLNTGRDGTINLSAGRDGNINITTTGEGKINIGGASTTTIYGGYGTYGGVNIRTGSYAARLFTTILTSLRSYYFPDKEGTFALTDDIPSVYNAGLTIQVNSSAIGTFTANASNSSIINIDLSEYATESWVESNYLNIQGGRLYGGITAQKDNTQGTTIKVLAGENNQGAGEAAITVTDSYYPEGRLLLKDTMGTPTTFTPSAVYPLGNQYSITIPADISQNETFATREWTTSNLSKYVPLSGTTSLYGSIIPSVNNAMLGDRSNPFFGIYTDQVNTSNVYIGDTNDGANLYWDGEYTLFGIGTAGYFEINNVSKYGRSGIALTTEGQFTYNGNEVATVNQINDATLTIQLNSVNIGTFTANASTASTINIDLTTYATQSWVSSNYLPLSGGTLTGSLYAGTNGIYAQTIGVDDGTGTGLSAGWYWDAETSTYILTNNAGPVEVLVSTYLRDTYVYGSLYYNGAEVATVNDLSAYVPYVGATSDVNLNSHALSGITNLSAENIKATYSITGRTLNLSKHSPVDHDATVTIVPHWRTMSEDEAGITFSANGGEYKFTAYDEDEANHTATVRFDATSDHMYYFPDEDGTVALETYVQANAMPSSTPILLSTIKVGSLIYAIPSQSGQGQFIPLSGTANLSGNIVPLVSNGYSYTLGGSNREFAALHVRNIYGAASEGLAVVATGGSISMTGVSGVSIITYSDIGMYAASSVSIRGEYGVDISAQLDINLSAGNNGDITLYADNDVKVTGGNFTFNSIPVATISYVQANPSGMSISGTLASIKIGSSTYVIPSVGSVSWGDISGNLNSQTDLMSKFDDYANLSASVNNFTGDVEVGGDLTLVGYLKQPISGGYINVFELPSESGKLALVSEIPDLNGYATEVYVDNHHTMVNATSLSDADIDKILVKGGIVILDDEQLSLTLAPPGEQLSLTMTNSINNNSTLSPTMLNTINNNDNAGLTPTMVSTELSI